MRQIEEFSSDYQRLAFHCMAWTAGLLTWVFVSVLMHMKGVDMRVFYTIIALGIGMRLYGAARVMNREAQDAEVQYRGYLDLFSYQVLQRMRNDPDMSSWSRREISRYLNLATRTQF